MNTKVFISLLIICCAPILVAAQNNSGSQTAPPSTTPVAPPPGTTTQPATTTTNPPPSTVKAVDVPPACKQPADAAGKNEQGMDKTAFDKLCEAGIGDRIIVEVEHLPTNVSPNTLVLFLEGRALGGINATPLESTAPNVARLGFDLKRTDASTQAWSILLSKPGLNPYRNVSVSVGPADKPPFPSSDPDHPPRIRLRLYYRGWAIISFIGLLVILGWFIGRAIRTGMIRDSVPPQADANKRPFSLARTQAAFWFFLVIGSFIFIYLVTGDYNTITEQALILIGIGGGTALGAAMIDANKNDTANAQLSDLNPQAAQLGTETEQLQAKVDAGNATPDEKVQLDTKNAQLQDVNKKIADASAGLIKPTTDGFMKDLLTDANGINFHRFQMLVWTIVLGCLFLAGVYSNLAMPPFSATLLALMGISSGTYLGFKIPEKQN